MLGRRDHIRQELDQARAAIGRQVAAYAALAEAVDASDPRAAGALGAFEPLFFEALALELDRFLVHRVRAVAGKDGNPLNEVELLAESLMNDGGVLRGNTVIGYAPERSVTGLAPGDPIRLGAAGFQRLGEAFLAELEARFV